MIKWSDEQRLNDYGIFCRDAMTKSTKAICIVSDIRRQNDIRYFREVYGKKLILIRIKCSDSVRTARGWVFQPGVDDIESECGLDQFTEWDYVLENDGEALGDDLLAEIVKRVEMNKV